MRIPRLVSFVAAMLLLSVALPLALGGCAPDDSAALVVYRVTALDGSPPTDQDMSDARGRLEIRLLEAGYDRCDVSRFGPDTVRVVLPESVAGKMPEIRALLEVPEDLPVRIAAIDD